MSKKKIVFLTGTRADFGKLKSLIAISQKESAFDVHIFATGMHMQSLYGSTVDEIYKAGFSNIFTYINHEEITYMDRTLAKTIDGFSRYIAEIKPHLIVVHGDRVEAMAGAIVGSLNNILVAHIEGGEISGTIDELIRHSVSKLSHIHLVTNTKAKTRLLQLGELESSIFVIGSPDLDLMIQPTTLTLNEVKEYYDISYKNYAIAMFHPVTTEYHSIKKYAKSFVEALIKSDLNYILIYPNNDLGSKEILQEYQKLQGYSKIKLFPSLRFEYFLKLLQNATFMIGNSSAGIREAPFYKIPTIDIGSRQNNRVKLHSIIHTGYEMDVILNTINSLKSLQFEKKQTQEFGEGKSDKLFLKLLQSKSLWNIDCQKQFQEFIKDE